MSANDIQFAAAMSTFLVLLVGVLLANAPFAVVLRSRRAATLRATGWLAGFAVWQAAALVLGKSAASGLAPQAWGELLSISFLLYGVLSFPAFVWRFLR